MDYVDFGEECGELINRIRRKEGKGPLEIYEDYECTADSNAKCNYENEPHHCGGYQNDCAIARPSIDNILNQCIYQGMYVDEKICYQSCMNNPACKNYPEWPNPGCYYGEKRGFGCECGHYVNMVISTSASKVACGLYKTPNGSYYSVQDFY